FALIQYFTWQGRFYWLRATGYSVFGPFVNHNHFAGYMAMLMPVPLALILRAVRGQARLVYGFAAALMGTAAMVSGSRSGVISLVAALVLMAILKRRCTAGAVYDRAVIDRAYRFRLSRIGPIAVVTMSMITGAIWVGATPMLERFGDAVYQLVHSGRHDLSCATIWQDTVVMVRACVILAPGRGT